VTDEPAMENQNPLKLHGYTGAVIFCVVAGLLWANVTARTWGRTGYGWPEIAVIPEMNAYEIETSGGTTTTQTEPYLYLKWSAIAWDLFIAVGLTMFATVVTEWFCRLKFNRTWFQIHLTTAIVLMFVAGGLLWLNMHRRYAEFLFMPDTAYWGTTFPSSYYPYGWPMGIERWLNTETEEYTILNMHYPWRFFFPFLINVVVGLFILFFVGRCCEWFIHRRETRAP
jgi:hypothetical protein